MPSTKPCVLIRADASASIGTGHVMRTLALGQALQARGMEVWFAAAECPTELSARLSAEGFTLIRFAACVPGSQDDAVRTVATARECSALWVILDGYVFGLDYQSACWRKGFRVLCVDDHQYEKAWRVDALLNQNLYAPALRGEYVSQANDARLLLGPDFALLRREFWGRPAATPARNGGTLQVLVTMGGVDKPNATALIMEALALIDTIPLKVTVLTGLANPHRAELEVIAGRNPQRFAIINAVEQMSALLAAADCVITAGGSTSLEVLWAGKPAAVLVIAENQRAIAGALHQGGLMLSLGDFGEASAAQMASRLKPWLEMPPGQAVGRRIDGKGARRVAATLDKSFLITIATAKTGWLKSQLEALTRALESAGHRVRVAHKPDEMTGGDFLFLLSYWQIVPPAALDRYLHTLVVHASDLPNGRGWSPATWRILEGSNRLPICLLEASERVDRGDIYLRDTIELTGTELIDEWREAIAAKTAELCLRFVNAYPAILATRESQPTQGTYYPRRAPADSRLDVSQTLEQLFNQLRVADNASYPAYFDHLGHRYILKIYKAPK